MLMEKIISKLLTKKIDSRAKIYNLSLSDRENVKNNILSTYDEAIENEFDKYKAYQLSIKDLNDKLPLKNTTYESSFIKHKIYFSIMSAIMFLFQLTFVALQNIKYTGSSGMLGILWFETNNYLLYGIYFVVLFSFLIIPLVFECLKYESKIFEVNIGIVILLFVQSLILIFENPRNNPLFYKFTFYYYFATLSCSSVIMYVIKILSKKEFNVNILLRISLGIVIVISMFGLYKSNNFPVLNELGLWIYLMCFVIIILSLLSFNSFIGIIGYIKNNSKSIVKIAIIFLSFIFIIIIDMFIHNYLDALSTGGYLNIVIPVNIHMHRYQHIIFVLSYIPHGLIFLLLFLLIVITLKLIRKNDIIYYINKIYPIVMMGYVLVTLSLNVNYYKNIDFPKHLILLYNDIYVQYPLVSIIYSLLFIFTGYYFINLISDENNAHNDYIKNEKLENKDNTIFLKCWNLLYILIIILNFFDKMIRKIILIVNPNCLFKTNMVYNKCGILYTLNWITLIVTIIIIICSFIKYKVRTNDRYYINSNVINHSKINKCVVTLLKFLLLHVVCILVMLLISRNLLLK